MSNSLDARKEGALAQCQNDGERSSEDRVTVLEIADLRRPSALHDMNLDAVHLAGLTEVGRRGLTGPRAGVGLGIGR